MRQPVITPGRSPLTALRSQSALLLIAVLALPVSTASADSNPRDNATFRPTVLLRQGSTAGSGTVISSSSNETLILTAAHVVEKAESVVVELHRYNLGLETVRSSEGWPRRVAGRVVASDPAADLAIVRVKGIAALPYVARLNLETTEPPRGTPVLSVGIDKGTDLNSWSSQVRGVVQLDMDRGGGNRPFLITTTPPELGRSGGGLYRAVDSTVIGVCVGRVEVREGRRVGVFASGASIRRLLRESHLEETILLTQARLRKGKLPVERTQGRVESR